MESQQQPKYVDTTSPEVLGTSEPATLAKLPPAAQSNEQWQRIGSQISAFLAQLPNYVGRFYNEYKQLITIVALILAAIISLRVVLAVIDALTNIPLLSPIFEFVGICYSTWFTYRYLLKASTRQELYQELQTLKDQVIGSQKLPDRS